MYSELVPNSKTELVSMCLVEVSPCSVRCTLRLGGVSVEFITFQTDRRLPQVECKTGRYKRSQSRRVDWQMYVSYSSGYKGVSTFFFPLFLDGYLSFS